MGCMYKKQQQHESEGYCAGRRRRRVNSRARAPDMYKPSVGRVGTTLGDVYQGRVCKWRWIWRTVSITAHTHAHTHADANYWRK